ncbi:ABC transporter permease, partial [Parabacteroides sp. OttesenSCG-928-G21]|nr:ABC transporter permease [Parabacteroides sp. OttesenSCG-928-G21]
MWNERRDSLFIGLELLVVAVCIWFAVDSLYIAYERFSLPAGFDINHTYYVQLGVISQNSPDYVGQSEESLEGGASFLTILDRLKQHPDVEAVCYTSTNHFHYRWSNQYTTFQLDTLSRPRGFVRDVGSSYFTLFQVKPADGGDPQLLADALDKGEIVINKSVAEMFFGSAANAIGKEISCQDQGSSEPTFYRIGGVAENQRYNEFSDYNYAYYRPVHLSDILKTTNTGIVYELPLFIRIKATADKKGFAESFRKEMSSQLKIGNIYLKEVDLMADRRKEHIRSWIDEMRMNIAVVTFFLLNAFLGVIGTFWLRTQQKRGEIGLRMALGATHSSIFRLLLSQGIVLLLAAFILAILIFGNLWLADIITAATWVNTYQRLFTGM